MNTHRRLHLAPPVALLLAAACGSPAPESTSTSASALTFGVVVAPSATVVAPPGVVTAPAMRAFQIKGLGARCIDGGGQAYWQVGEPIILYGCNGTVAQQFGVAEVGDGSHDITLHLGAFCVGVHGVVTPGSVLELQACNGSPLQRFAFDGDALLVGTQSSGHATRDYVIEPNGQSSVQRTPLVVAARIAAEAEYFTMTAIDNSGADPTSGFFHISNEAALDDALLLGWGTVVVVDEEPPLVLTSGSPKTLPAGFTLRGYRKTTDNGPLIHETGTASPTFDIPAGHDHVRVTGLRLQGPTSTTATLPPAGLVDGIHAFDGYATLIDHNDISGYPGAAVEPTWTEDGDVYSCAADTAAGFPLQRPTPIQVLRNFLHDNESSEGYGVSSSKGAFPLIEGNTFTMDRHAVTADPHDMTGYAARYNLTTSDVPSYGSYDEIHEQDFDMHGADGAATKTWNGGISGDTFDIGWNTFLGTNRNNVDDRGTPCRYASIHDNIFTNTGFDTDEGSNTAIASEDVNLPWSTIESLNTFGATDPTDTLGAGDFDGDGVADVFLGTGNAWFYSSGGQGEWRWLRGATEHAGDVLFGDFDGDGRTDVMAVHSSWWDVSWGGASPWQTINKATVPQSSLHLGDFDGDGRADVFYADGTSWFVSSQGTGAFTFMATSHYLVSNLRFGDFNGDHKTDVFGISGGVWSIVPGGGNQWQGLQPALADIDNLVVGDFDGDGFDDIGITSGDTWSYSKRGRSAWNVLATDVPSAVVPVAMGNFDRNFDRNLTTDAIVWGWGSNSLHFLLAPGAAAPTGVGNLATFSRQEMR